MNPVPRRVTLVHAPRTEYQGRAVVRRSIMVMPVGLLGLADALDRAGHDVEVLHLGLRWRQDPRFSLAAHLRRRRPGLVGFSLQWHHQLHDVLEGARAARAALSGARIVLGGFTASAFAEELLERFPFVDAVVAGEGERPLVLLAGGAACARIPNLVYRKAGRPVRNPLSYCASQQDMDRLDFARFDLLRDAESYDARWVEEGDGRREGGREKLFYMCGGRGCSVACSFCGGSAAAHRALAGRRRVVLRSPHRLLLDAAKAAAAGYRTLYLCFDPPGADPAHYLRFFSLVRRAGLKLGLIFECYRLPGAAFLDAFAATFDRGLSQIALSPDSADEKTRRRHKGYWYSNAALERCLAACARRGLRTTAYFTLFPEEGWPQARRLGRFAQRLKARHGTAVVCLPIEPEPGALWQAAPERWGWGPGPYDLDYFLERHRRVATPPGDPDAAFGLDAPGRRAQFAFLEGAAG